MNIRPLLVNYVLKLFSISELGQSKNEVSWELTQEGKMHSVDLETKLVELIVEQELEAGFTKVSPRCLLTSAAESFSRRRVFARAGGQNQLSIQSNSVKLNRMHVRLGYSHTG